MNKKGNDYNVGGENAPLFLSAWHFRQEAREVVGEKAKGEYNKDSERCVEISII